jgi:hypothetical protein
LTCRPTTSLPGGTATIAGSVAVTGSVDATPAGLHIGGKITQVTLSAAAWTQLPPSHLALRNSLSIQNVSGTEIKINYDNTEPGYVGVTVASGSERHYLVGQIPIYAKAAAGTPTIQTEEIA